MLNNIEFYFLGGGGLVHLFKYIYLVQAAREINNI